MSSNASALAASNSRPASSSGSNSGVDSGKFSMLRLNARPTKRLTSPSSVVSLIRSTKPAFSSSERYSRPAITSSASALAASNSRPASSSGSNSGVVSGKFSMLRLNARPTKRLTSPSSVVSLIRSTNPAFSSSERYSRPAIASSASALAASNSRPASSSGSNSGVFSGKFSMLRLNAKPTNRLTSPSSVVSLIRSTNPAFSSSERCSRPAIASSASALAASNSRPASSSKSSSGVGSSANPAATIL